MSTLRRRMGDSPLVRLAVHQQPEGLLQRGALLACTLDFQAGRDAAATGAAPRCTEAGCLAQPHAACCWSAVPVLLFRFTLVPYALTHKSAGPVGHCQLDPCLR